MKKKVLFSLFIFSLMAFISPVMARDIASCDSIINGALIDEKIPNTVSMIVNIIKVVVPILLVIFGSIDLIKGLIAQKDDEIKKGQQIFIKRLIAGALVFFVFVVVQLVVSLAAGNETERSNIMTCAKCFLNKECTYK